MTMDSLDKPSWFWRRTLVFGICVSLVLLFAVAFAFNLQGALSDKAFADVLSMVKVVLPAVAVAYIGGAVWDDFNFSNILKNKVKEVLKHV